MSAVDPVSDFLAREQEALGDLGQEINLDDPSKGSYMNKTEDPSVDINNFEDISNPCEYTTSNGGFVLLNGNSETNNVEKDQPTFDAFDEHHDVPYNHQNSTSNGFSDKDMSFDSACHSEATEKWREEFMERIKKKDAEEEVKKAELEDAGKKELENWYKRYKQQLETRSKDLREKREDSSTNIYGNTSKPTVNDSAVWESICEMCDFQAKPKVAPDMSRMRGILLSLKPNS